MNPYAEVIDLLNTRDAGKPQRKAHRLPQSAYADSGAIYFFTLCARERGQPFTNELVAQRVIDALLWRRQQHGWALYCYCLMPDHLHFLVKLAGAPSPVRKAGARGVDTATVLQQVADFKSYTTREWWRCGGAGKLWQRSSYDRVAGDGAEDAASYILNNPVRKGLVEVWSDYRHTAIVDDW